MNKREWNRILAVDDNPTNIAIAEKMIGNLYNLRTALSGEEALDVASEFQPDLILLDIMMPGMDGYEVCRRIRSNKQLRPTKIIMVTAKAMLTERLEGYAVGADDYITKPFDIEELMAKINVYLRLKSVEEVEQMKNGVLSLLNQELSEQLNGILLPTSILMSDHDMKSSERNMLAEMVYRNTKRLHTFLEEIAISSYSYTDIIDNKDCQSKSKL